MPLSLVAILLTRGWGHSISILLFSLIFYYWDARSGAPESSEWQELSLTNEFSTQTFVYTVPLAPPASFDIIAIWADSTGKNLGVDISSIIVKTIDDTESAP